MNSGVDLFPWSCLLQVVLILSKEPWLMILPRINKHKTQSMSQHTCVVNKFKWPVQKLIFSLNIKQPNKLSQSLRILWIFLFQLQFEKDFLKLTIKGNQERDFLDKFLQIIQRLRVLNCDTLGVFFQRNHNIFQSMFFDQFIQRKTSTTNFLTIKISYPLRFLRQVIGAFHIQDDFVWLNLYNCQFVQRIGASWTRSNTWDTNLRLSDPWAENQ